MSADGSMLRLGDVVVGELLPPVSKLVTNVSNFLFGVPMWTAHRLHYDLTSAQADGFDAPVIPGALMSAYAMRVVVDWSGHPNRIRRFAATNLATETVGATLDVTGEVTEIEVEDDSGSEPPRGVVTCELTVSSGETALMRATAMVHLPG